MVGLLIAFGVRVLLDGSLGDVLGALGVTALVFAAIQFGDARRTIRKVKELGQGLKESTGRVEDLRAELVASTGKIEEQLSTRRIGEFPDFLPKIVELLSSADKGSESILICCDFPAYAEFSSAPSTYREYADCLQSRGDQVRLLCLDDAERLTLLSEQIRESEWQDWRTSHAVQLSEYLALHGRGATYETIEHRELLNIFSRRDAETLDEAFADATVFATERVMPLYFWIVDGPRAIFSVAQFLPKGALEVGFYTTDESLISALKGIFARYQESVKTRRVKPL